MLYLRANCSHLNIFWRITMPRDMHVSILRSALKKIQIVSVTDANPFLNFYSFKAQDHIRNPMLQCL